MEEIVNNVCIRIILHLEINKKGIERLIILFYLCLFL